MTRLRKRAGANAEASYDSYDDLSREAESSGGSNDAEFANKASYLTLYVCRRDFAAGSP
jgi:hypothetical protein